MAVYYKWIKGCASGSSLTDGLWTYLKWGNGSSASTSVDNLPHIFTYKGKQDTPKVENDLGYILTNKATNISLEASWKFNNNQGLSFYDNSSTPVERAKFNSNSSTFYLYTRDWTINDSSNSNATMMHFYGGTSRKIEIGSSYYPTNILGTFTVKSTSTLKGEVSIDDATEATSATTGALKIKGGVGIQGNLHAKGECHAQLFNATSDKRAKENLQLATYNAIELIKKLPVYIYNYKNQTETVTGILAQDLLESQPAELNLVSNTEATGLNGDYMSIKSDKIMFVLLKAIQEQQKQIEILEQKIENLINK